VKIKENFRNFWRILDRSLFWIFIGSYIIVIGFIWYLFYIDLASLLNALLFSLLYPLAILELYDQTKTGDQIDYIKYIIIGCGGFGFGGILWLIFSYCLVLAPWAPLNKIPRTLKEIAFLILSFCSCSFAAFIAYRFGRKRKWKINRS
jgi:hypothetical protein